METLKVLLALVLYVGVLTCFALGVADMLEGIGNAWLYILSAGTLASLAYSLSIKKVS
jgi:hypothetical protein